MNMERSLKDKVVIITGGASGIGLAIANSFIQRDPKTIIILDFDEAKGIESTNNLKQKYGDNKVDFLKCDVTTDLEEVSKVIIDKYKKVDVLVNNAGVHVNCYRKTLAVNLIAVVDWSMKFIEHMKENGGGTIINMGSILSYKILRFYPAYQTSKFGVLGFTKSQGHPDNYSESGVRIIALCPGFTYTGIGKNAAHPDTPDYKEYFKNVIFQEASVVGEAAVEVFEKANSGTAWEISESQPIFEV